MNEYKIKKEDEGIRLDKIISQLEKDISRTTIQRMIEEGNILVNGNIIKTSYKVAVVDSEWTVSWNYIVNRYEQLKNIGFEATLNDYNSNQQRKLMTPSLRKQIMKRDNYTCQICGKYMPDEIGLHIDHIIPIAKGGKSVPSNLRVLCSKCNGKKGAK